MLYGSLVLLYIIVSIFLILVVLLQTGKKADLAGAFGGGGSQTALGTRGAADLLTKLTTGAAVLFMVTALMLSILASRRAGVGGTVLDEVPDSSSAPAGLEQPPVGADDVDAGDADADGGDDGNTP